MRVGCLQRAWFYNLYIFSDGYCCYKWQQCVPTLCIIVYKLMWYPRNLSCIKMHIGGLKNSHVPAGRVLLHRGDLLLLPALADAPKVLLQVHPQEAPRVHGAHLLGRHLLPSHWTRLGQLVTNGIRKVQMQILSVILFMILNMIWQVPYWPIAISSSCGSGSPRSSSTPTLTTRGITCLSSIPRVRKWRHIMSSESFKLLLFHRTSWFPPFEV